MPIRAVRKRLQVAIWAALFVSAVWVFGLVLWLTNSANHTYPADNCAKSEQAQNGGVVCESFWKRTTSDPVAFYTLLLFIGTATLAGVTGYLVFYTSRLWSATVRLGRDSERSISASEKAAEAARAQIALTHQEFVARNRPRLKVRHIGLEGGEQPPGGALTVNYTVMNSGGNRARIKDRIIDLQFMSKELRVPDYTNGDKIIEAFDLEPIGIKRLKFTKRRPEGMPSGRVQAIGEDWERGRVDLYFVGTIRYQDANDTWHRMSFCRRYDRTSKRFLPVDDPDYEYDE